MVLSHRPRHQTQLLVSWRGEGKGFRAPRRKIRSRPASSVSPPSGASTRRSIANARAELPLPQTRVEPETSVFAGSAPAMAADATRLENDQRANAGDIDAQRSVVASRWPEASGMSSSAYSAIVDEQFRSQTATQTSEAAPPACRRYSHACRGGRTICEAVRLGAAVVDRHCRGAVAGGPDRKRDFQVRRRAAGSAGAKSSRSTGARSGTRPGPLVHRYRMSARRHAACRLPEGNLPREPRAADDPNERVAQMLARLARSAAT